MPQYAIMCDGRLESYPYKSREEVDKMIKSFPSNPFFSPSVVEIFVLVPALVWDEKEDWINELEDKVEW